MNKNAFKVGLTFDCHASNLLLSPLWVPHESWSDSIYVVLNMEGERLRHHFPPPPLLTVVWRVCRSAHCRTQSGMWKFSFPCVCVRVRVCVCVYALAYPFTALNSKRTGCRLTCWCVTALLSAGWALYSPCNLCTYSLYRNHKAFYIYII